MHIQELNNVLYHISDFKISRGNDGYIISMNAGKSHACVFCFSRSGNITQEDLDLSEDDVCSLFGGGSIEDPNKKYILKGIRGQQLKAISQYRDLQIYPPVYVQVWSMTKVLNEKPVLLIPNQPNDIERQRIVVPVSCQVQVSGSKAKVTLDNVSGYQDGDLMYQYGSHDPIPIPKSWIGKDIPMRFNGSDYRFFPAPCVKNNYIFD